MSSGRVLLVVVLIGCVGIAWFLQRRSSRDDPDTPTGGPD